MNELDWFPRCKNEGYETRMNLRPQIFSNAGIPSLQKRYTKENIKNIRRFNRFVYDYWNDRL